MANRNHNQENNFRHNHLVVKAENSNDQSTIYKLRLSMKRRLSPQSNSSTMQSPEGTGELRSILQRLVEIDTESRELLIKVFSMLDKDEKLEKYVARKIEDPQVSKMWQLVEQVLACQDGHSSVDELLMGDDYVTDKETKQKDGMDEEMKLERFKIRTLNSGGGGGVEGVESSTTAAYGKK